ncbi:unnamed protein product [Protopolystoma xenopodis]|uniref:Protein RFT1 homolog n=1 Tax=Protopolystoma xenopodis TaxID=117903 RepID=A0A3S5FDV8_9PLAT|nr:unnamed protein product [Protopolystoma xenopodis]
MAPSSYHLTGAGMAVARYTFVLQIGLRIMTFGLNALAFRYVSATDIGLVNLRLGLFYSTLMFAAREAFRRACLSRGGQIVYSNPGSHQPVPTERLLQEQTNVVTGATGFSEKCLKDGDDKKRHQFRSLINVTWFM